MISVHRSSESRPTSGGYGAEALCYLAQDTHRKVTGSTLVDFHEDISLRTSASGLIVGRSGGCGCNRYAFYRIHNLDLDQSSSVFPHRQ